MVFIVFVRPTKSTDDLLKSLYNKPSERTKEYSLNAFWNWALSILLLSSLKLSQTLRSSLKFLKLS